MSVKSRNQSPEFVQEVGIHSGDLSERTRTYSNGEDRTGTLGVVTYVKSKGKVKKYIGGKRV